VGTCTHWKAPPFHGARQNRTMTWFSVKFGPQHRLGFRREFRYPPRAPSTGPSGKRARCSAALPLSTEYNPPTTQRIDESAREDLVVLGDPRRNVNRANTEQSAPKMMTRP